MYTYIPSYLDFLPIQVTTEHWQSSLSQTVVLINSLYHIQPCIGVSSNLPIHPTIPFTPRYPYISSLHLCLYFCLANLYHFSRFQLYALIYNICLSVSDLLYSVRQSLGPPTSLQMQFHFFYWVTISPLYVPHLLYPFFC